MNDYQIKDILAQFCVMIHCLNDMTKSISEMQKSIKEVMSTLDNELNKVEPVKNAPIDSTD
ncbi:MAG: hypothetical protein J6S67_04720 [Methanobrevibacter sp.]|nr:hypothetical protein [Methanobrevibacter sp.]